MCIETAACIESKRIRLYILTNRRIIMPVPVPGEARFELEPLAREACVEGAAAGDRKRLTEGLVLR